MLLSLRALVSHPPLARCATRASRRPISPPLSSSPPRVCRCTDNQEAEKDDFDEKLKEVQDICSPIISKVYKESGGAPGGGGDFGGDDDLDGHDEL